MKQHRGLTLILLIVLSGPALAEYADRKSVEKHKRGLHNHLHRHGNVLHNHAHAHKRMHKKFNYTHHHDPDQHYKKQPGLEKQKWIKPGQSPSSGVPTRVKPEIPAAGGKPAETVEEAERRTPQTLRHRNRAVDSSDMKTQTRKIPGVKITRGATWRYRYTAATYKTALRQGIVHRGKIKWRCRKITCKSWVGYRIPRLTDCRKLRKMVGKIKVFGHRYRWFNRKQLRTCNR